MVGNDNFFFDKKVGILESMGEPHEFKEPVSVRIEMVQNGFELSYRGKSFIAKSLKEALGMIEKWMEDSIEDAEEDSGSEHNSDHG